MNTIINNTDRHSAANTAPLTLSLPETVWVSGGQNPTGWLVESVSNPPTP